VFKRPLATALLALALVIALGTTGYVLIEGWRPLDALWMVVITLTTIGFAEVHPLSDAGRLFTLGVIVSGVSVGAYALSAFTRALLEGDLVTEVRRRRRRRKMERLSDHFIVIGFGRLGRSVAGELRDAGVPFCVVERDPDRVREAEDTLKVPVIIGDGSDDDALRAAGIERARGVAVAAGMGAESIFATLSARQLNPSAYIVTRAETTADLMKARRAGADAVVSPYGIGGWRMAHGLLRPMASHFLDLATLSAHEDILLEEFLVPPDSSAAGKTCRELRIREQHNVSVVAILRADGSMLAAPGAGDVVIIVGKPEGVRALASAIEGQRGPPLRRPPRQV
jgi:voltage-gated potassium channel